MRIVTQGRLTKYNIGGRAFCNWEMNYFSSVEKVFLKIYNRVINPIFALNLRCLDGAYELSGAFLNPYSPQSILKESPFPVCGMMVRFG